MEIFIKKNNGLSVGGLYDLGDNKHAIINITQDDAFTKLELSEEIVSEELGESEEVKEAVAKQIALDNITVLHNGKLFDASENSMNRMVKAIAVAETLGLTSSEWKLHKDTEGDRIQTVTIQELKEVLAKGMLALKDIVL